MEQTYLPLFRKYRPQSFEDIVGQESLVKALSNAIELNRIAQAYLFCGPRGTGKTSTARILAKSLNCEHGPTLKPCQKCASCVDITNASGLDVIEIDAASNRGIQDAKELIAQVQYAPINGKYKIFIIDEVHMLSNDAFNALLKTFEEPPKNVIFILATTEPHKVLETIVSRCQRFDLKRITIDDIVKRLREISDIENIKITDSALYTIAKNVSGGLRDSLALLDQVSILGVKDEIDKDLIEELLGKINFDTLLNLLNSINSQNIEQTLINIDEIYSKGNEPRNLAENFMEFLRNVIMVLNSNDFEAISSFTNFTKDDIEKIKNLNLDKDRIIKILNTIIEYYKEIKVSTNPYLWMELAGIGAARLDLNKMNNIQISKIKENSIVQTNISKPVINEVKQTEISIGQTQVSVQKEEIENNKKDDKISFEVNIISQKPVENSLPQENSAPQNNSSGDITKLWSAIISAIPSLPARAFYSGVAKLVNIENNKIILGFLHDNTLAQAKTASKMSQLQSAIDTTCNGYSVEFIKIDANTKTIDVKPKISSSIPISRPAPQNPQNSQNSQMHQTANNSLNENYQKDDIDNEEENKEENKHYSPKVQEMLEQFSGRIIE